MAQSQPRGDQMAYAQVVWSDEGKSPFETTEGLTVREWMIGHALAGVVASPQYADLTIDEHDDVAVSFAIGRVAKAAVACADAVLAEMGGA